MTPFEPRLVGDRADNVAGFDAVGVAHFETEGFEYNITVVIALAASGTRVANVSESARIAVARRVAVAGCATVTAHVEITSSVAACSGATVFPTTAVAFEPVVTWRTAVHLTAMVD